MPLFVRRRKRYNCLQRNRTGGMKHAEDIFMGAGSTIFAKNVLGDSMMTPALKHSANRAVRHR